MNAGSERQRPPIVGTTIGSYEILDEIGKGGMATVYRAYQSSMDRLVAIKVINQALLEDETLHDRFQREARLIARLEHPHILPVYDFDGSHIPPYIVMRFLEGGTLKEVTANRELPISEVLFLIQQVSRALQYAHQQGVVHQDIKPSNIMIDREGNAFIMDFGIARLSGGDPIRAADRRYNITMGTADYMSPEQIMGLEKAGPLSDLYSLAVTIFEILAGQLPFNGEDSASIMLKHLQEPVPSASGLNRELPRELDRIFRRALSKEPGLRHQSVREFVLELSQILGTSGSSHTPTQLSLAARASARLRTGTFDSTSLYPRNRIGQTRGEQFRTMTALYAKIAHDFEIQRESSKSSPALDQVYNVKAMAVELIGAQDGIIVTERENELLALWGAEIAREDDAERAVRAALSIMNNFVDGLDDEPDGNGMAQLRIGVSTGLALLSVEDHSDDIQVSGDTIEIAKRLTIMADGLILVSQDTFRQIQGVFDIQRDAPVRFKRRGRQELIDTYRVTKARPRAFRHTPRSVEGVATKMIGRQAELETLSKAYFDAVEESETQMVTVVGEPGIGKSRLLFEFATWADLRPEPYFIIRVRATPAMTSRPFAVWRDMLSFRFEILDTDNPEVVRHKLESGVKAMIGQDDKLAHLVAHLAGFEFENNPFLTGDAQALAIEARNAALNFISRLCKVDPTVVQLDDLHHADEATLDLLADLSMLHPNMRLLIVGTTRPVLFERRPAWGSGLAYHRRIDLRRLDRRDSRDLVAEVLKRLDDLPRDLRDLIVDRAEGNPYYVEELVKMLVEDRVIQKVSKTRWIVEGSRLEHLRVPQTLIGLLQTRLDTLLVPERLTLQRAAVIGRVFHDGALRALDAADDAHIEDPDATLADLVRREFIFPRESSAFAGNREFIFGQAMLRDVILETLLERQITRYSLAMAAWLGLQGGDRAGEYDALIASYLEKAGEPKEAAEYMLRAGRTASARGALNEAIALYKRGLDLLSGPEISRTALDIRLSLAATYGWLGDYLAALEHLEPAVATARSLGDRQAEASALAQIGRIKGYWQGHHNLGLELMEDALDIVNEVNDQSSRAFVLRQLGNLAIAQGNFEEASRYLSKSLATARILSDNASIANALNSLGEMARHQGHLSQARAFYDKGLEVIEEENIPNIRSLIMVNIASVLIEEGNLQEGLLTAQDALTLACDIGTKYIISTAHAVLSRGALAQGDVLGAWSHLKEASTRLFKIGNWPEFLSTVPDFAILMAREEKVSEAIEWLGMALARSELSFATRQRVNELLQNLGEGLTHDIITNALEMGANREMSDLLLNL